MRGGRGYWDMAVDLLKYLFGSAADHLAIDAVIHYFTYFRVRSSQITPLQLRP